MDRRFLALLVVLFSISVGRMLGSESIQQLRSIDIVTLFAGGTLFGMVLLGTLDKLRGVRARRHPKD